MTTCIRPNQIIGGQLRFPFFYHMTHKDNVAGILKHGILSWTDVRARGIAAVDISDPGAQRWRDRQEPANHRAIHDYAPMYINPKNPMLYVRRERQREIVILKISPCVLEEGQHVFSDGNAASHDTQFSSDSNIVARSIAALNASYWGGCPDGKRRRCAELLVYPNVPPSHIISAICSSSVLAEEIALQTDIQVEVDHSMFF